MADNAPRLLLDVERNDEMNQWDQRSEEQKHIDRRSVEVAGHRLDDYWNAPSGVGPLAAEWADKPHRLLYDLIGKIEDVLGTFA